MVLTVRKVGNSIGVILPAEAAKALHVGEGDKLFLTRTQDGYRLSPYDPDLSETMRVAEGVMRRYRNTLRELGK
jgi:putative addiction module antidote